MKGKRCIGYVPVLKANGKYTTKSVKRKAIEQKYYHWIVECLCDNVNKYLNGILVTLFDGKTRWLIPVIALVLTDWPEGQKMCACKEGATSSPFNCRVCMTPQSEFGDTRKVSCVC